MSAKYCGQYEVVEITGLTWITTYAVKNIKTGDLEHGRYFSRKYAEDLCNRFNDRGY
jgi:hypothetical protein